ncbi:gliding motility-associated C-terminal domain-containing protein [Aequorivita marisscotiae]|uniref:Gliding motility-associated C-terminal domain-containing protein n=1 Tax=Aequorivita marisscotiae TaxID=3040348 RepID=A0ABY8KV82_9FLAO|nr:gliding motility-associated C-terminal domain-containing protein [Aequorivita sp. Ant34-E75]WGF93333.1 gliding motility-associated C-terminal domain-containing protein [Aequorivita sp. Ant34-E75]
MKNSFKPHSFLLFSFLFISVSAFAQGPGCPNVYAGEDVELDCGEPCTDLTASYLDTGETTSYQVTSIPYDPPFPFTGGTPVSVNTDDVWSPAIQLPFDFCFFGQTYTQMVIGSNAVISFDLASNSPGSYCSWSFDESIPDPNLFFTAIFGPYMDVDPSVGGSGQINWAVFGDAPCRTMVVNFPGIPYFGSACTGLELTSQVVIYETTNVVEVYIQDRPDGCSWNDGNAVVGIQNQNGTQGYTPPGRNTGDWLATDEAWRFTPNGASNVVFSWLDSSGTVIGTDRTINVCPTDPTTTYTAQAVYTNCNGDIITETDEVVVTTASGNITLELGPDLSFCDTPSYEIIPEITGDTTGATYLWSPGGETTPTITVTTSGTYTLEITKGSCVVTDSVNILFLSSPNCTIEPICEGVDFEENFGTGTGRVSTPYTNYTFNGTTQVDDGEYTISNTSAGLNTGWFPDMEDHTEGDVDGRMLFVNASFDPDEFYRRTITLNQNIEYTFNAWITTVYDTDTGICSGSGIPSNVIFRIEDPSGNLIAETNTGDIPNGPEPNWQEFAIVFNTGNNTDVQLVLINNSIGGCGNDLAIDDITLSLQNLQPEIVTPPDLSACDENGDETEVFNLEDQISIILNGQDPALFNTSFHLSQFESEANQNAITNPSAYTNVSNPETIYVRVEKANEPTCFSTVSFQLIVNPIFDLSGNLPSEVQLCVGDDFPVLDATPSDPGIDLTLVTYEWTDENGNTVSTDATYTPTDAGTYNVTVSYPPCSEQTFVINVIVNEPPVLDLGSDQVLCNGSSFEIVPVITGNTSGITYLWSTGETTPTITVSESGTYTLEITVGPCVVSDSIDIIISDPVMVNLGDDFSTCFESDTILTAQVDGDPQNATYEWYLDGILLAGENNQTLFISQAGEYTVVVTVGSCSGEDSIVVSIRDDLEVALGANFQTCPNQPETLTATTSEEDATFQWYLNGTLLANETNNTLNFSIEAGTMGTQTYSVVITVGGCSGEDSIDITLYDVGQCVISEGLSPNGDGYNDTLDLTFLNDRTGISKLQIFNRLGALVFEQNNYINQWSGQTQDGNDLPSGTYFYVIDLAGNDAVYGPQATGWIYLNQEAN